MRKFSKLSLEILLPYIYAIPVRTHVIEDKTSELQKWINSEISKVPTVETVSVSLIKLIDDSTREKDGGQFLNVDGTRIAWW